jgi:hypothetical protein
MIHARSARLATIVVVTTLALTTLLAAGCAGTPAATTTDTPGAAKAGLKIATSALSTTAPDAKLLVVQTAQAVAGTATPVWAYLFGSPKTDAMYVVYVNEGTAMPPSEYGTAGLSAAEWAAVPAGTDSWKIDSPEAYKKAVTASGATTAPVAYFMGFQTYSPKSKTSTNAADPYVWYVSFEPGKSGATTATIKVNATTGAASVD